MSRIPALTPRQVVAALKKAGVEERRQKQSSFPMDPVRELVATAPMHTRDLPRGTLKAIIQQAGLTEDEFLSYL